MGKAVAVGEAKKRLSEIMARVAYRGERFIILRRGKPMAGLVSPEDLERLEQEPVAPMGLLGAVGALAEFDEFDQIVEEIYRQREQSVDRAVSLEN